MRKIFITGIGTKKPTFLPSLFVGTPSQEGYFAVCDTRAPEHGLYLMKMDLQGELLWQRMYDTGENDLNSIHDLQTTSEGGTIFSGVTLNRLSQDYDLSLIKTDSNGAIPSDWSDTN